MLGIYVLALIDSLSIGTFVIPLILLLRRQSNLREIIVYCTVLGVFYFVLGVLLLLGVGSLQQYLLSAIDSTIGLWVQLVVGSSLLLWALFYDSKIVRKILGRKEYKRNVTGVWEKRISTRVGLVGIASIAILAGILEAATMAPYIAAIAIIGTSSMTFLLQMLTLLIYCIVMFVPVVILVVVSRTGGERLHNTLEKFKVWMERQVSLATPWVLGLIGFFLAQYAASQLFN